MYAPSLTKATNTFTNDGKPVAKGVFLMVKVLKVEDLDCAHCAAKIEDAIKKLDGVNSATVSFFAQKITVDVDEDKADTVLKELVKTAEKIEPDCTVVI